MCSCQNMCTQNTYLVCVFKTCTLKEGKSQAKFTKFCVTTLFGSKGRNLSFCKYSSCKCVRFTL